jgi:ATP-dependent DNA ligase
MRELQEAVLDGEAVSKKVTAPYLSGRRSSWLKVKNPGYERP